MNPALLLVSGRRDLLLPALARLEARHGRVLLVAPSHVVLPEDLRARVLSIPQKRFGIGAGLAILSELGCRWPDAYFLAPSIQAAGMTNVIAAAAMAGARVRVLAPDGEADVDGIAALRAEGRDRLAETATAAALLPCWLVSSLALAATTRNSR